MDRLIPRLSADERTAFIAAVRRLLTEGPNGGPVPFKRRGRSLRGIDCIGCPVFGMVLIGFGAYVQDLSVYSSRPDGVTLRAQLQRHLGEPIRLADAQPGDIPLMRWHESNGTVWHNHVGVVTQHPLAGELALLHSFKPEGRVIEHRIGTPWDRRIVEVYRP